MFRIECFVEDKQLSNALKALAGLVRGQPSVAPVVNILENGHGAVAAAGSGRMLDILGSYLAKSHRHAMSTKEVAEWMKGMGWSPTSTAYLTKQAVDCGILKRGARPGMFIVPNKKPAKKPEARK